MSQNILISGQGKTGTTGIYNAVKDALRTTGDRCNCQFEPTRPEPLLALGRYDPSTAVLTKIMSQKLKAVRVRYQDFDKRIMTVRDPRDIVISRLLFFPLIRGAALRADEGAADRFVEALRAKEEDPDSLSVVDLHELAGELGLRRGTWQGLVDALELTNAQIDRHDFHVVAYEDFVEGRLDDLSDHLGMTITNPAATGSAWLSHIPRSMSHGEWRNWFTKEDVDFFAELFAEYMRRHGYDPSEQPHDEPRVDPATSSEYVEEKLASRREQISSRRTAGGAGQSLDGEELVLLSEMADDGDSVAGYRAARALSDGTVGRPEGVPSALELARGAARRGHLDAMGLTARLLREVQDDGSARAREMEARFWDREADLGGVVLPEAAGASTGADRLRRRLKRAREERDALASSTRYRAGSLLADLARGPFSRRRRAGVQLARMAKSALRARS